MLATFANDILQGTGELKKQKKTPYIIVRLFFFYLGYKNIEAPPNQLTQHR